MGATISFRSGFREKPKRQRSSYLVVTASRRAPSRIDSVALTKKKNEAREERVDGQYSELSRAIFMDFFSPDCSLLSLRVRCLGIDICARLLLDVSFAAVAA